jgi:hypothetical protein
MFVLAGVGVLTGVGVLAGGPGGSSRNCATSIGRKGSRRSRSRDQITLSDSLWSASRAQVSADMDG